METLTKYDERNGCYVMKPHAPQGQIIQRLGELEHSDLKVIEMTDDYRQLCIDLAQSVKKMVIIEQNGDGVTIQGMVQKMLEGYKLCKVDEAIEKMREVQGNHADEIDKIYLDDCVEILKEACK